MATVGSSVWLEDPVAWIDGQVVEVKGPEVKVLCSSGKTVLVKASDVHPNNTKAPTSGVDDMTKLAYLHELGVLQNLRSQYDVNKIYTYAGNVLIAINPFAKLPHVDSSNMMAQYKRAASGELSPHPFAVADAAYRLMINEGKSQTILVSGESRAGITESTKLLIHYLANMDGRAAAEGNIVGQKVLMSNTVLEAFGNARIMRNDNASRFGKLVEIQFDQEGRISGASVRTYLLERSRVCQISDRERNYHCFYMLCAAPQEDIHRFKLGHPRTFHYLNQSNCFVLEGVDDLKEYIATRRAMDKVGISADDQETIFGMVAAILHLGNIEFVEGEDRDSSKPKDEKSWFHLKTAAELLMCNTRALEDSLCKHVFVARGKTITKFADPDSAACQRDALAKLVYSRLFDWIVKKINSSIGQDPNAKPLIGVLDINGLENFEKESFKQFCPNLTSEKFQQSFNQHVLKMEHEEHTEEIGWKYINFADKLDVLDLMEKQQLHNLLETLSATQPHYIRCVKPNNLLKPAIFENKNVQQQLHCGGVVEASRIRHDGYLTRRPFVEFLDRFGILAHEVLDHSSDEVAIRERPLEKVGLKGYQATREIGALQAAKCKLEKQVEELARSLQVEKRMRADLEESNNQEIARLQSALNDVQLQFKETKELLLREQEAAKRAAKRVSPIKEILVIDHTMMQKVLSENEKLKGLVNSLEKKIADTEKKYEEIKKISEERLKQAQEAESKISEMKMDMQRLNKKICDMESENQILQQQTLLNSAVNKPSENSPTTLSQEDVDALMTWVVKNFGISHGKLITALTIYKSLRQWKSSEAERTQVLDQPIQMIGSAVEGSSPSSAILAAAAAAATVRLVEARYPALPCKQLLTAFVEKIYRGIGDNLKKNHGSFAFPFIQVYPDEFPVPK